MASLLGLITIFIIYVSVGALALVGTTALSRRFLRPRAEQVFYAAFLIAIAVFYLAFNAHLGSDAAWRTELWGVGAFSLLALVGMRFPIALMIGYPLHGLWDLLHELRAFESPVLTAVPLAYGAFCATYDVGAAIYTYLRRTEWARALSS